MEQYLEELVGRNFKAPNLKVLASQVEGKTLMITGAGGSIGAELTRQLSRFNIKKLILIEHAEYNLYKIIEEMGPRKNTRSFLTSICDYNALRDIFWKHRPDFVFHAAAYKHVPLVENNQSAGILNNILGTQNLLNLCCEYGIEKFVLISTDKAVRPTNLMGATKRICELMISEYAQKFGINCCAVRFGNVAGSSGSLIPKWKEQIESRKPLTITDQRMERYFMLIPEAVGLVLKASEGAAAGQVSLLNMGEPIKIKDLAIKMIKMHGLDPKSYPIEYIGKRPGEKLCEELSLKKKNLFKGNKHFAHIDHIAFTPFTFNGKEYRDTISLVADLAFYARNQNPKSSTLVWLAIKGDFIQEQVEEEEIIAQEKLLINNILNYRLA